MKIVFTVIGKTSEPFITEGFQLFVRRLKHYIPFEYVELPDVKVLLLLVVLMMTMTMTTLLKAAMNV